MKIMKKPVTLIIVSAMALSLAACGNNKEAEETAATKDVQAKAQAAKEEDTAKEPETMSTVTGCGNVADAVSPVPTNEVVVDEEETMEDEVFIENEADGHQKKIC